MCFYLIQAQLLGEVGSKPWTTLSSIEAKYVAVTNATKETIWLRKLLGNNQIVINPKLILLMEDNQSAIKLSKNSILHH
jgi:hypothetical protein